MGTTENVRIAPIQGGVGVIQGGYTLDDIHENVWLSQRERTCLWWECMRMTENGMHENDWGWLRIAHIQGGGGGHSRLIYIIRHAWYCMCDDNAWEWMRMYENHSYSGRGVGHSKLICNTRHPWECIILSHHEWTCLRWECMGMTENVWESLLFREVCWSFNADIH